MIDKLEERRETCGEIQGARKVYHYRCVPRSLSRVAPGISRHDVQQGKTERKLSALAPRAYSVVRQFLYLRR